MEDLKTSQKDELAKLKKGCDDQLAKMKEDHAAEVKIIFPDLDEQRLGEADAKKRIENGKLIDDVPPAE
ncbi:hypothetical protein A2U01_0035466 [Trifolium medium]|uniref:Uncharacterized protein n=1 Tax=Trifolium medium TaxID=97028 RepID=A0A392PSR2_9FABA|nr:hypothetical protein [Trifolium medium]